MFETSATALCDSAGTETLGFSFRCQVMCQGTVEEISIGKTWPTYYLFAVLYDLLTLLLHCSQDKLMLRAEYAAQFCPESAILALAFAPVK